MSNIVHTSLRWPLYDTTYPNLTTAKQSVDNDDILIGRCAIVLYTDVALPEERKRELENFAINFPDHPAEASASDREYIDNFRLDSIAFPSASQCSKDRMLLQKIASLQPDGSYKLDYQEIGYVMQTDNSILKDVWNYLDTRIDNTITTALTWQDNLN